jgi:hypothetical protein
LARSLRPVAAPDALWERVDGRRAPEAEGSGQWILFWPVAAALMLTMAGGVAWRVAMAPETGIRALAVDELQRLEAGGERLDFRSDDAREIQTWVKSAADIDIDLPGSSEVRLLGARLIRRKGAPVAAVAYQAGEGTAALLVSGRGSGGSKSPHVFAPVETSGGSRVYSWKMREQEYTLASSVTHDPHAACLLCHSQPQMTLN